MNIVEVLLEVEQKLSPELRRHCNPCVADDGPAPDWTVDIT